MSTTHFRSPAHLAGAILRTTAVAVSTPLLSRSRRNAAGALHDMRCRHLEAEAYVGVAAEGGLARRTSGRSR